MERATGVLIITYDLAGGVDPVSRGIRGAGDVNGREGEREGCRCADEKSEERSESRGEAKECLLKNFSYVGVGFTIPSENFARRCKKMQGSGAALLSSCSR
jgi:hypothetical protein